MYNKQGKFCRKEKSYLYESSVWKEGLTWTHKKQKVWRIMYAQESTHHTTLGSSFFYIRFPFFHPCLGSYSLFGTKLRLGSIEPVVEFSFTCFIKTFDSSLTGKWPVTCDNVLPLGPKMWLMSTNPLWPSLPT